MQSTIDWSLKADKLCLNGKAFVNGQYIDAHDGKTFTQCSPIDGRDLISIASCSEKDINDAVFAARSAFEDGRWSKMIPKKRKKILFNFAELIEKHKNELALLDTLSMGKPIRDCLNNDIPLAVECIKWYAELIDKIYDECLPAQQDVLGLITREPLGVVGAITPWNYPMENISWKIAPALAIGNSLILKPAEESSLSAIYVAQLAIEAGIPNGVFNVMPGLGEITGKALALHPDVDGIFFTGSTYIGKQIMQYSGQSNLKRVALECGGKSAFIVLKDCDRLDVAAEVLARNIFLNQGQTCTAPSRLIVEETVREEVINKLIKHLPDYQPGNPLDETTNVGAIASHEHLQRVQKYIKIGCEENAKLIAGGKQVFPVKGGSYFMPTIFDRVENSMRIAQDEIFGPVLSIITVKDASEAIKMANKSRYGLAAAVWSDNLNVAHQVAREIRAGLIHVNSYGNDDITAPFGGYKQSGSGSKDKSLHAINDYSELKTTWIQLQKLYS